MTKTPNDLVTEFHQIYNCPIRTTPSLDVPEFQLRIDLIREEFEEFLAAMAKRDIVDVADALGDMVYVIYGAALTFGIPLDRILEVIQRSNLSKLGEDGKPIYGDGVTKPLGKVLKGPGFFEPEPGIQGVLNDASNSEVRAGRSEGDTRLPD